MTKKLLSSSSNDTIIMSIGNPAGIDNVNRLFRDRMNEIINDPSLFQTFFCKYSADRGEPLFLQTFAQLLNETYNWNISERNIAVTCGSQMSYFFLYNIFAESSKNTNSKILLPLVPEYFGYFDLAGCDDILMVNKPLIEILDKNFFKYKIDFSNLQINESIKAICISRPTNPSGNVVTDEELMALSEIAKKNNSYLIVDNAYGIPFPKLVFKDIKMIFDKHIILTYSLSKLGFPGLATGIIIADEIIINKIAILNGVSKLTVNNFGQGILLPFIKDKTIFNISDVINKYYKDRLKKAYEYIRHYWKDFNYKIHICEGGFFIWAWFEGIEISSIDLQKLLIKENVLIIPGNHFFYSFSNNDPWKHENECIRISYALDDESLEKGIKNIANGLKKVLK